MSKFRLAIAALSLSAAGLVGIVVNENYAPKAVIPVVGDVPTIGFGSTTHADGRPVRLGDTTTPVDALIRAQRDVTRFEGALKRCVTVPLTQGEYDVYVDLTYNIGPDAFCSSTITSRLNARDYVRACDAILMWKFYKGQNCSAPGNRVCAGLWTRRLESHRRCLEAQP